MRVFGREREVVTGSERMVYYSTGHSVGNQSTWKRIRLLGRKLEYLEKNLSIWKERSIGMTNRGRSGSSHHRCPPPDDGMRMGSRQ